MHKLNITIAGVPASGKSTIAHIIQTALNEHGIDCEYVDEDGIESQVYVIRTINERLSNLKQKGLCVSIETKHVRLPNNELNHIPPKTIESDTCSMPNQDFINYVVKLEFDNNGVTDVKHYMSVFMKEYRGYFNPRIIEQMIRDALASQCIKRKVF